MKIKQIDKEYVEENFSKIQTIDDLLNLFNYVNHKILGGSKNYLSLKTLKYFANPNYSIDKRYKTFEIVKKSGETRIIHSPVGQLKRILRVLNVIFQIIYKPHKCAIGFVPNKSIVINARKHVGKNYVYNIDLKDFFYSFDRNRVKMALMKEPFNLKGEREPLAFFIASLCTHPIEINGEKKIVLPQGSPTSPTITNIICRRLDKRLNGLARRYKATYSRYADDITFSSNRNIFKDQVFINELKRIIEEDNLYKFVDKEIIVGPKLSINEKKERIYKKNNRQVVTGLVVNEKVNVPRKYIKQIRMWLYYWENYGYEKANSFFKNYYIKDKGHVKTRIPNLKKVIFGKLCYLKMVKGENDSTYLTLINRYKKLKDKEEKKYPIKHNPLELVKILKYFSANDKNLKYTTHWEPGRFTSYDDFMEKIEKEWKVIGYKLKNLNKKLYSKIWNFLFNKNLGLEDEKGNLASWGEKRLKFGWSSPELKEYMSNPENSPFNCPIPDRIKKLEKDLNLMYFEDYVEVFKNEIRFRENPNNFKNMIYELWQDHLGYDFKISGLEKIEGISFYTDVQWIKTVIKIIFESSFKKRPQYPKIELDIEKNFKSNVYIIKFTQLGSDCLIETKHPKICNPSGDLGIIIDNLKNLADYSIVSRFNDGKNYRINYLVSESNTPFIELIDNEKVKGFTHELKFYL